MPSLTTHYSFYKPLVADAIDEDLWGGYLNDNFDAIDDLIYNGVRILSSSKTGAYTLQATDNNLIILADATTGSFNITLPSAVTVGDGWHVIVKKIDASANTVTLLGTIDGGLNYVLDTQGESVEISSNGTAFYFASKSTQESISKATSVYQTNGTLLPDNATTLLTYDTQTYDELGIHSTSVNPGRFTFSETMRIQIWVRVNFNTNANSDYTIIVNKNGALAGSDNWIFRGSAGSGSSKLTFSDLLDVAPGDYLETFAFKQGSGNVITVTGPANTSVKILRVK